MSGTEHARPQQRPGHRTRIRSFVTFNGHKAYQATCSCGRVGPVALLHVEAERQAYEHRVGIPAVAS
jgi:hypothetical protein